MSMWKHIIDLNFFERYKINPFCFRCTRHQCKKIYPLLNNIFFKDFKKSPIEIAFELFKCFIDNKFNAQETFKYFKNNLNYDIQKIQ